MNIKFIFLIILFPVNCFFNLYNPEKKVNNITDIDKASKIKFELLNNNLLCYYGFLPENKIVTALKFILDKGYYSYSCLLWQQVRTDLQITLERSINPDQDFQTIQNLYLKQN